MCLCGKVVKRQNVEKWEIEAYLDWLANGDERKHIWLHESCNKKLFRIGMSVHCVVKE